MATDSSGKHTVLFIDDDIFFLDLYSRKAHRYNIEMKTAQGGDAAFKKLKEGFTPDVFVVDLDMPGMDGFQFIEQLRSEHLADSSKIVILTNKNDPTDIERARALGVDKYIIKATRVPSEVMEEIFVLLEQKGK